MTSSSDSTGGPQRPGQGRDAVSTAPQPTTPGPPGAGDPDGPGKRTRPGGGRPPLWALIAAGVLVVVLMVVAVVTLSNRQADPVAEPEQQEVPEAEVITLPPPTPAVDPIAKEPRTAFYDALPSTVLAHALAETADEPGLLVAGALESYRLVYTDGDAPVVLLAGQWVTPEGAVAAYQTAVQAQTAAVAAGGAGDAGDGAEADPDASTEVEEGPVQVDGAEVGRWTLVPRGDGSGTLTWTNGTAMLQLDGPVDELRDLHTAFPV